MLSEKSLKELIDIYKNYRFEPSLINQKEDMAEIINILLEIPFFEEIKKVQGYIKLKNIVYNMNIKLIPKNSLVFLNNEKEHKCYLLLYGLTKEETKIEKNRSFLGRSYICIKNSYFGVFDSLFYINNILTNNEICKKKFIEKLSNFKIFSNIFVNYYNKLFLSYDEEYYSQNEIVYSENDKINGVYLIIEGEFQLFKKIKQKTIKELIKNNNEEINDLKSKSKLFRKIILGEGQEVIINKKKVIEEAVKSPKLNPTNIRFYLNKIPYSLLKLKIGDMFGDLEIIQKFKERKLSVKATGLKNIIWFFPKNIIKEILFKTNNDSFQKLSNYKYEILKKQFNQMKKIQNIRKQFNINNKDFPKIEKEEGESKINNNNLILNIKKIKINKTILEKSKKINTFKDDSFSFITQKYRSIESISPRYKNKTKHNSSLDIKKKIIKYLFNKKNKYNSGGNTHNFSDDNSLISQETPFSLITKKRIATKREFVQRNYRCYSNLKKNKDKIKFFKSYKELLFSNKFINDFNNKTINNNIFKRPSSLDKDIIKKYK